MNYRLYKLAAEHILTSELPGNYGDEWLESNVREEYKGLTARQIEGKIQDIYSLTIQAYHMGIDFANSVNGVKR